jgi:2-polyprenyl-3-methyl-5-hydroxy-6-metoxy-1,4-benzoquinol methylase
VRDAGAGGRAGPPAGAPPHDADTSSYRLPPEHEPVLADEGGPVFFGGVYEELSGTLDVLDRIGDAFRTGGGVPSDAYSDRFFSGLERFTAGWFDNLLLPEWLPAMPDVAQLLEAGADVADVGCGRGRALIALAEAFPASRYVGYDNHAPSVEAARQAAEVAGVADQVRFEHRDVAADGLPATYDVVTTFDVVHDAVDPAGLLKAIRAALRPNGRYVCVDINASHRPEENTGPIAALFYGFSNLYCLTSSLAHGGTGLGTCGFNPHTVERMCKEAGFSDVRTLPLDNPFNHVYEITA